MLFLINLHIIYNIYFFAKRRAYWIESSRRDWQAVRSLYKGKNYLQSLFFAHLVLEKLCKAHWVKDNVGNIPPKIHNLTTIVAKTKLKPAKEDAEFLSQINQFQLEGGYPDYLQKLYKTYKAEQTKIILDKVNVLRKWILKEL